MDRDKWIFEIIGKEGWYAERSLYCMDRDGQ